MNDLTHIWDVVCKINEKLSIFANVELTNTLKV